MTAPSEETSRQIISEHHLPSHRVRVVLLGSDPVRFYPADSREQASLRRRWEVSPSATVLAYVGRLDVEKRVHLMVRYVKHAAEKGADVVALICGAGPCEAELKQLSRDQGIENRVRFLGWIADPRPVYAVADLNVLPSLYETFALTIVEGMMCGVPAFRNNSGGSVAQVIPNVTGRVFERTSEAAFQFGLDELVNNRPLLQTMSENCRTFATDRFSIDAFVDEMEAVYVECAKERCSITSLNIQQDHLRC